MEKDVFWFIFVLIALFFGPFNHERYQTTGMGSRVLVLDKTTGEAWISVETGAWGNPAKTELTPVQYSNNSQRAFAQYISITQLIIVMFHALYIKQSTQ